MSEERTEGARRRQSRGSGARAAGGTGFPVGRTRDGIGRAGVQWRCAGAAAQNGLTRTSCSLSAVDLRAVVTCHRRVVLHLGGWRCAIRGQLHRFTAPACRARRLETCTRPNRQASKPASERRARAADAAKDRPIEFRAAADREEQGGRASAHRVGRPFQRPDALAIAGSRAERAFSTERGEGGSARFLRALLRC